jgi:hypothetical protein
VGDFDDFDRRRGEDLLDQRRGFESPAWPPEGITYLRQDGIGRHEAAPDRARKYKGSPVKVGGVVEQRDQMTGINEAGRFDHRFGVPYR